MCPNYNTKEYKDNVAKFGEIEAYNIWYKENEVELNTDNTIFYQKDNNLSIQQQRDNLTASHNVYRNSIHWTKEKISKFIKENFPDLKIVSLIQGNFINFTEIPDKKSEDGYFQKESNVNNQKPNQELNNKLKALLLKLGINIQEVEQVLTEAGQEANAATIFTTFNTVIKIAKGKLEKNADLLPEEVGHIIEALLGKDNPLFKIMYKNIISFKIYQKVKEEYKEDYGDDKDGTHEFKIRFEAIGKLMSMLLLDNKEELGLLNEEEKNISFFNKLINKVWEWFKSLIGQNTKLVESFEELIKPFMQVTDVMQEGENADLESLGIGDYTPIYGKWYQLAGEEKQNKIIDDLNDFTIVGDTATNKAGKEYKTHTYYAEGERGENSKMVHESTLNAINVVLGREQEEYSIPQASYETIKKAVKRVIDGYGDNTKFIVNYPYYNNDSKKVEFIDLVAILPDGDIDVKDFKEVMINRDRDGILKGEISFPVKSHLMKALKSIKAQINKLSPFSKVKHIRIAPIRVQVYKDEEQRWKVNGIEVNWEGTEQDLQEFTTEEKELKDDKTNELLRKLESRLAKIEKASYSKEVKNHYSEQIVDSISQILINNRYNELIEAIYSQLSTIDKRYMDMDELELKDSIELIELYDKIEDLLPVEAKVQFKKNLSKIHEIINNNTEGVGLKEKVDERFRELVEGIGEGENIDLRIGQNLQFKIANQFKKFRSYSNKWMATMIRLIDRQNAKIEKEVEEIIEKLKGFKSKLGDSVKSLINPDTKDLYAKYSADYYKELEAAVNREDWKWIEENTISDETNYKEYWEKYKANVEGTHFSEDAEEQQSIVTKKLNKYRERHDIYDKQFKKSALVEQGRNVINHRGAAIKPSDAWFSKEYKALTGDLKEFYDFWLETMKDISDTTDESFKRNLIPYFKKGFFDNFNLSFKTIMDSLEYTNERKVKNELTNKFEYFLPKTGFGNFVSEKDKENKSDDLYKILATAYAMKANYQYKSEIEGEVLLLQQAVYEENVLEKDNKEGSKVTSDKQNYENFTDAMNSFLYGVSLKEKSKLNNYLLKGVGYYQMKALTLNMFSALANMMGGAANIIIEAHIGKYFNGKDIALATGRLIQGLTNQKVKGSLAFFDLERSHETWTKVNNLSMNIIEKYFTKDNLLFLQRGSDKIVKGEILLAMLEHYTIRNDKILKKEKGEQSLYDLGEIKDGVFSYPVSPEEVAKFRVRVQNQIGTILGIQSGKDSSMLGQTIQGKLLLSFRNWIPNMFNKRYGQLNYNFENEEWVKGRYRTLLNDVVATRGKSLIGEIMQVIPFMKTLGLNKSFEEGVRERAKLAFLEERKKDPRLKEDDLEEYIQMYSDNMRANVAELRMILGFMMLIMLAGGFGDDKKKKKKAILRVIYRGWNELSFFYNPAAFMNISASPVPSVHILSDIGNFIGDLGKDAYGKLTGDIKMEKDAKPLYRATKLLPTSFFDSGVDLFGFEEYNLKNMSKEK